MQSRAMATDVGWTRPAQALRRALPRARGARARPDRCARVGPGSPEPLGVTLGARRRERRRLLRARDRDRALPLRRERRDARSSASRCRSAPATCSTASSPASRPASATACARTARTTRAAGHRFNAGEAARRSVRAGARPAVRASIRRCSAAATTGATRDDTDSAPFVPKGIVTPSPARRRPRARPRVPWARHDPLRAARARLHAAHPGVPEALRGTCAGLAHPAALAHLTRLGITTVELMPIAACDRRAPPRARSASPTTGATTRSRCSCPIRGSRRAASTNCAACVAALHAAGIEVILDVVLNHTGEGDALGPTLSLRGLDNATYYRTLADDRARYVDDTGCGNTLALDRPPVLRLALDALRYYARGRGRRRLPLRPRDHARPPRRRLRSRRAAAAGDRAGSRAARPQADRRAVGRRAGRLPARRVSRPAGASGTTATATPCAASGAATPGCTGELATRLAGSADVFAARSRPPSRSVNFVAAHDGFTLADLVAYAAKHNEANGEDNRDGSDANYSWNHGVEGPTTDAGDRARARARDVRNLLATLLLSRGTPMLAMGDELGRTQQRQQQRLRAGQRADVDRLGQRPMTTLIAFVAQLIALRKRHPALRADRWLTGAPVDASGLPDVEWRHPDGRAMTGGDWTHPRQPRARRDPLRERRRGRRRPTASPSRSTPATIRSTVRWPDARDGFAWRRVIDTALPAGHARSRDAVGRRRRRSSRARSVVVLVEEPDAAPRRRQLGRRAGDARPPRRAPPASPPNGGICPAGATSSAPTRSARCSRRWDWRPTSTGEARDAPRRDRRRARAPRAAGDGRRARRLAGERRHRADARRAGAVACALRLQHEDGTEHVLPFAVDDLPANVVDGRRRTHGRAADARAAAAAGRLPHAALRRRSDCRAAASSSRRDAASCRRNCAPARAASASPRTSMRCAARGDQGIGDFTTLPRSAEATARAGGSIVGINPLHALFAEDRERASPYHPSDRRFLDPIYIDVERVPDLAASDDARALLAQDGRRIAALAARASVDYAAVWQLKQRGAATRASRASSSARPRDPLVAEFERFVAAGGAPLRQFALFEAIAAEHPRVPWHEWPHGVARARRRRASPNSRAAHARRIRFALYLQWLADRQFAAAAARRARERPRARVLSRSRRRRRAGRRRGVGESVRVRARRGDRRAARSVLDGRPELEPAAAESRSARSRPACAGFRELVAANMRHAGALRIDHVMGLSRLFWIPDGATRGRRRLRPLSARRAARACSRSRALARAASSSARTWARCPRASASGSRRPTSCPTACCGSSATARASSPPSRYPAKAVACVSTHDLPTIAGWWTGADIAEKRALGLLDAGWRRATRRPNARAAKQALADAIDRGRRRRRARRSTPTRRTTPAITAAIHRYAGASASALVLLQADDLAGETAARQPARHRPRAPELAPEGRRRRRGAVADAVRRCRRSPISRPAGRVADPPRCPRAPRQRARLSAGDGPAGRASRE